MLEENERNESDGAVGLSRDYSFRPIGLLLPFLSNMKTKSQNSDEVSMDFILFFPNKVIPYNIRTKK